MKCALASAVLSMLAVVTTAAPATPVCQLFSQKTTLLLKFSSDGSVTANGRTRQESSLYVHYIDDKYLRIESVKTDAVCFLTYQGGKFQGGEPVDGNEVFEQVTVGGPHSPFIALRVVNTAQPEPESGSASGSGETPEEEKEAAASDLDCFLGFSSPDSEPMCFPSTNFAETRFQILH